MNNQICQPDGASLILSFLTSLPEMSEINVNERIFQITVGAIIHGP